MKKKDVEVLLKIFPVVPMIFLVFVESILSRVIISTIYLVVWGSLLVIEVKK